MLAAVERFVCCAPIGPDGSRSHFSEAQGHLDSQAPGLCLEPRPGAEPGRLQPAAGTDSGMPGPGGTMVVHPFGDGVVGRPGGASDSGHVEADAGLKEPRQRVTGVPGTSRLGIDRIGVDRLEIPLQLIDRRLVGRQEIDPPCGVVIEPCREPQNSLGLLDLCVEVALVHDR